VGTYQLRVRYPGDVNHAAADSTVFDLIVV
jgi:hypothetical protein